MSKLSKNILKKIKKEEIAPIPRWHFVLSNLGIWAASLVLMVLGINATMLIFYFATNLEILDLIIEMPHVLPKIMLLGLPIFWILLMVGLAFFAGYSMQKTKRGYKHSFAQILTAVILIQLGLGGVLAETPLAGILESKLQNKIGFESLEQKKRKIWDLPEQGLFGGKVISMDEDLWRIRNREGEVWQVVIVEETALPENVEFGLGRPIRIKGEILDKDERVFQAREIFPLRGRHKEFERDFRKEFQHLPPAEREKIREKLKKDGPPHIRKFLESLPVEKRLEILDALKNKQPEERRAFFEKLRPKDGRGRGGDKKDERRWQDENIENPRSIRDN